MNSSRGQLHINCDVAVICDGLAMDLRLALRLLHKARRNRKRKSQVCDAAQIYYYVRYDAIHHYPVLICLIDVINRSQNYVKRRVYVCMYIYRPMYVWGVCM